MFAYVHICVTVCEQNLFLLRVKKTAWGIENGGKGLVIHFTFL